MFTVFVENLSFYAYHGVSEAEHELGHRLSASVWVTVDGRADQSDLLSDTVDYREIASTVLSVSASTTFATVEALAGSIARAILRAHPHATKARVRLSKLLPPMPVIAEAVGAEVEVARGG